MKKTLDWSDLIGKKVKALRGIRRKKSDYGEELVCELRYVLFGDGETFLELEEQNCYDYHDCSSAARHLNLYQDKRMWQDMMDKIAWPGSTKKTPYSYDEPDDVGSYPF